MDIETGRIIAQAFNAARESHFTIGMKYKNADHYIATLEKADVECKYVKREGASCSKNNNCTFPQCVK